MRCLKKNISVVLTVSLSPCAVPPAPRLRAFAAIAVLPFSKILVQPWIRLSQRCRPCRDGHRPSKEKLQRGGRQHFHHRVLFQRARDASRFGSMPLVPRVAIQSRCLPTGMVKYDHRVTRAWDFDFDSPIGSVWSFEFSYVARHFSLPVSRAMVVCR